LHTISATALQSFMKLLKSSPFNLLTAAWALQVSSPTRQ